MKLRFVASMAAVCFVCLFVIGAEQESATDRQDYGAARKAEPKKAEAPKNLRAEQIDTSDVPKPEKDYVDALFTGTSGCFFLGKGGKGWMIAQAGISVANSLKGYGSTQNFWIYEIVDFKAPSTGKKEYLAFLKKGPNMSTGGIVLLSKTVDNPQEMSSFTETLGYATRGEKQGNMME